MHESSEPQRHRLDEALAAGDALKRLARRLVRDEATADDLVQDVWIAALESPPGRIDNAPAWLSTVVRNVAAARVRRESRGRQVDQEWADSRPTLSPDSPVERESIRRHLLRQLGRLEAPYREALYLRYIDGLSYREVAERLQSPEGTIRTKVRRGLAALRERLSKEFGDDHSWGMGLIFAFDWRHEDLPDPNSSRLTDPVPDTVAARRSRLQWLAGVTALVLGAGALRTITTTVEDPRAPEPVTSRGSEVISVADIPGDSGRLALGETGPPAPGPDEGFVARQGVRVVDQFGQPVAGARILVAVGNDGAKHEARGVSDRFGNARIPIVESDTRPLLSRRPIPVIGFVARASGRVQSEQLDVPGVQAVDLVLRLRGSEVIVRGRVTDHFGSPVQGARVYVGPFEVTSRPLGNGAWISNAVNHDETDSDGHYEIRGVSPRVHKMTIYKPGWPLRRRTVDASQGSVTVRNIRLERGGILRGRVLGSDGEPRAGIPVFADPGNSLRPQTLTDGEGRYELRGLMTLQNRVTVLADDHTMDRLVWKPADGEERQHDFRLRTGRELSFRVVDAENAPVPDVPVLFRALDIGSTSWNRWVLTNEDGVAHVCSALDGEINLVAETPGADISAMANLTWQAGESERKEIVYHPHASPAAVLTGICLQADGSLLGGEAAIFAYNRINHARISPAPLDPGTGAFRLALPGGLYGVEVETALGATLIAEVAVPTNTVQDLGVVRIPAPGRVEVEVECESRQYPSDIRHRVLSLHTDHGYTVVTKGIGLPPKALDVLPSICIVILIGSGFSAHSGTLVHSGHTQQIRVVDSRSSHVVAYFSGPEECVDTTANVIVTRVPPKTATGDTRPLSEHLALLESSAGKEVASGIVERDAHGWFRYEGEFAPGWYHVLAETAGGWMASAWAIVSDNGTAATYFTMELRME